MCNTNTSSEPLVEHVIFLHYRLWLQDAKICHSSFFLSYRLVAYQKQNAPRLYLIARLIDMLSFSSQVPLISIINVLPVIHVYVRVFCVLSVGGYAGFLSGLIGRPLQELSQYENAPRDQEVSWSESFVPGCRRCSEVRAANWMFREAKIKQTRRIYGSFLAEPTHQPN